MFKRKNSLAYIIKDFLENYGGGDVVSDDLLREAKSTLRNTSVSEDLYIHFAMLFADVAVKYDYQNANNVIQALARWLAAKKSFLFFNREYLRRKYHDRMYGKYLNVGKKYVP